MERHAFAFKIKEGCFEQSRQDTFCWETRMLEIMERFTDDVDGSRRSGIRRAVKK